LEDALEGATRKTGDMFVPRTEAFFGHRGNEFAVHQRARGGVRVESV
jgi:hypothetical protein